MKMKRPVITVASIALAALLLTFAFTVSAQHNASHEVPSIPERNGDYPDPTHPGVRVHVFVHPERPTTESSPVLVCNLPDPESAAVVSATPWHLPSQWTYNLNPSSVPASVGGSNLPTIALNGFTDWRGAMGNKVTFNRGSDTTVSRQAYDGRNIVAWGRTSGSALGVTYVRYYSSSGLLVDVDTIMNKKFPWSWANSSTCADSVSYDAENILYHEQGHWLGLDDEYDVAQYQDASMYGYGSKGEVKKTTLTNGDKVGAAAIYP